MLAIYAWAVGFICTVWILYWTLKHVVPVRLVLRGALASDAYFLFDGSRLVKPSRTGRQLLTATEMGSKTGLVSTHVLDLGSASYHRFLPILPRIKTQS